MEPEPIKSLIKLNDGPWAGETLTGWPGEPPALVWIEKISNPNTGVISTKVYDVNLTLDTEGRDGHFYRKASRSQLFDLPPDKLAELTHVMPGCTYDLADPAEENQDG